MYQSISFCGFGNPRLSVIGCWDPFFSTSWLSEMNRPTRPFWLLLPCCCALDQPRVVDAHGDHPCIKRGYCSLDQREWTLAWFLNTDKHAQNSICAWLHVHKTGGNITGQKNMNLIWWHTRIHTDWNIHPSPNVCTHLLRRVCELIAK